MFKRRMRRSFRRKNNKYDGVVLRKIVVDVPMVHNTLTTYAQACITWFSSHANAGF